MAAEEPTGNANEGIDLITNTDLTDQEHPNFVSDMLNSSKIGCNPSKNSQNLGSNGRQNPSIKLPILQDNQNIDIGMPSKTKSSQKNSRKTAIIDPVSDNIMPTNQTDSNLIHVEMSQNIPSDKLNSNRDSKVLDNMDEIEAIYDGLSILFGHNLPEKLSSSPPKIGPFEDIKFGDVIPKLRQAGLVRLPDLGMVVIQSEVSTSNGRQARKLVKRKRRKKEEESVKTNQMNIKDYFQKIEDLGSCRNGKRKKDQCPTEKCKKLKVGNQTTV